MIQAPKLGDRVTVTDLASGSVWDGRVVDTTRYGDRYVIVEDDDGITARVGVGFVSVVPTQPCGDCGYQVYWDDRAGDYRHVDPARSCFLHPHMGGPRSPQVVLDELAEAVGQEADPDMRSILLDRVRQIDPEAATVLEEITSTAGASYGQRTILIHLNVAVTDPDVTPAAVAQVISDALAEHEDASCLDVAITLAEQV